MPCSDYRRIISWIIRAWKRPYKEVNRSRRGLIKTTGAFVLTDATELVFELRRQLQIFLMKKVDAYLRITSKTKAITANFGKSFCEPCLQAPRLPISAAKLLCKIRCYTFGIRSQLDLTSQVGNSIHVVIYLWTPVIVEHQVTHPSGE